MLTLPLISQAFQYERYEFPELCRLKISDEKCLQIDNKGIFHSACISQEQKRGRKKKKKELSTQEYSQFWHTFPATEAIRKSKASSAHIWA
jgi:hypothetical protein